MSLPRIRKKTEEEIIEIYLNDRKEKEINKRSEAHQNQEVKSEIEKLQEAVDQDNVLVFSEIFSKCSPRLKFSQYKHFLILTIINNRANIFHFLLGQFFTEEKINKETIYRSCLLAAVKNDRINFLNDLLENRKFFDDIFFQNVLRRAFLSAVSHLCLSVIKFFVDHQLIDLQAPYYRQSEKTIGEVALNIALEAKSTPKSSSMAAYFLSQGVKVEKKEFTRIKKENKKPYTPSQETLLIYQQTKLLRIRLTRYQGPQKYLCERLNTLLLRDHSNHLSKARRLFIAYHRVLYLNECRVAYYFYPFFKDVLKISITHSVENARSSVKTIKETTFRQAQMPIVSGQTTRLPFEKLREETAHQLLNYSAQHSEQEDHLERVTMATQLAERLLECENHDELINIYQDCKNYRERICTTANENSFLNRFNIQVTTLRTDKSISKLLPILNQLEKEIETRRVLKERAPIGDMMQLKNILLQKVQAKSDSQLKDEWLTKRLNKLNQVFLQIDKMPTDDENKYIEMNMVIQKYIGKSKQFHWFNHAANQQLNIILSQILQEVSVEPKQTHPVHYIKMK